jgi:hypothetical protein
LIARSPASRRLAGTSREPMRGCIPEVVIIPKPLMLAPKAEVLLCASGFLPILTLEGTGNDMEGMPASMRRTLFY